VNKGRRRKENIRGHESLGGKNKKGKAVEEWQGIEVKGG